MGSLLKRKSTPLILLLVNDDCGGDSLYRFLCESLLARCKGSEDVVMLVANILKRCPHRCWVYAELGHLCCSSETHLLDPALVFGSEEGQNGGMVAFETYFDDYL